MKFAHMKFEHPDRLMVMMMPVFIVYLYREKKKQNSQQFRVFSAAWKMKIIRSDAMEIHGSDTLIRWGRWELKGGKR